MYMTAHLKSAILSSLSIALLACGLGAFAGTAQSTLTVSASVLTNCNITTTGNINFGSYDPLSASNISATGAISIACTKNTTSQVGLNLGVNFTGTTRRMINGTTNYLTYELYSDAGMTSVWGNASPSWVVTTHSNKVAIPKTIYGKVPAGQDIPAGSYSDTITATINF